MVDYACALTERLLERALAETSYLTAADAAPRLPRRAVGDLPVPVNR